METIKYNNICLNLANNDFKNKYFNKNLHFVGIGGVSVSSLAIYALYAGCKVSGTDSNKTELTIKLEKLGIKIFYSHNKNNVANADYVIYSNACENNIEVQYAKQNGIQTLTRAEFLAEILKEYNTTICISGAHGKTTTTALIYEILKTANFKPSLHLGGNLVETGCSYNYSQKQIMVCESCEYKDSFLNFKPSIGIILNLAPEHLDYFKTFNNVKKSFKKFAEQSQILITNENVDVNHKNKLTFGWNNANFTAKKIKMLKNGTYSFDCCFQNTKIVHIKLNLIGKHNIINALSAICVFYAYKYILPKLNENVSIDNILKNVHINILKDDTSKKQIQNALKNFKGIQRRYEYMHKSKFIVHDYAHHPDEISFSIKETLNFYKGKLLIIFQPHTYSRTKTLMKEFVNVFKQLPEVLIIPTYSAREKYIRKGSAVLLAKNIGSNAMYIKNKGQQQKYILNKIKQGYGVLLLGAGDIYNLAKNIAKKC